MTTQAAKPPRIPMVTVQALLAIQGTGEEVRRLSTLLRSPAISRASQVHLWEAARMLADTIAAAESAHARICELIPKAKPRRKPR